MTRGFLEVLVIFGLTLTACGAVPTDFPSGVPSAPAWTPTASSAPSSTPTRASAAAACPVPPGSILEPEIPTILDYLNAGGAPDGLAAALEEQGLAPLEGPALIAVDLTGDGLEDLALAHLIPPDAEAAPGGITLILECAGQAYRVAYQDPLEFTGETPVLHFAQDLTGDGVADLITAHRLCGAHTCFEQVMALTWVGLTFENRLQGASDDLPYPVVEIVGPDESGGFALALTSTGIASVGAGPYRQRTRTWRWDPVSQALLPGPDALLPSNFRIHVLLDADQAALAGDYAEANDLYHRVITDEALEDVEFGPAPRDHLIAYAMFRQVVTYALMRDLGDAQAAYGILQNTYPDGAPGRAYAELATAFRDVYAASEDTAAACAAARAYAAAHQSDVLGPLYYGYANPTYTEADLCPFG